MRNYIASLLIALTALGPNAAMASKIQQQGIKTAAECVAAGATAATCLPLDSQIYVTANGTNDTLNNAIANGAIGGLNAWVTGHAYLAGNVVSYGQKIYIALSAHTSGSTLEADIQAGKWRLMNQPVLVRNNMTVGFDFEDADTGGWTAVGCATVTNGLLACNGSGAAAFSASNGGRTKNANTTAPAVVSSGQISGSYSLNFAASGATAAGDMYVSQYYPVDIVDQAKVMQISFDYKLVSGTVNMSGTSSNTYGVAIYDIDNNTWLPMAGNFNIVQSSGVGHYSGTVQFASNATKFQIAVYNPTAGVSSSLYLDNFYVGPQMSAQGPAMSDWVTFTPTGSWTSNTTYTGKWRRIGDSMEVDAFLNLTGAPTSTALSVNLPSGYSIDTTKLSNSGLGQPFGIVRIVDSGVGNIGGFVRYAGSTTSLTVGYIDTGAAVTASITDVTQAAPHTFKNLDTVAIRYSVPIVGWSSNSVMSADTATNVVSLTAYKASGTITQTNTGNLQDVTSYATPIKDTNGGMNTSTGVYTFPVSGQYLVSSYIGFATNATGLRGGQILQAGSAANAIQMSQVPAVTGAGTYINGSGVLNVSAGDTVKVQAYQSSGGNLNYQDYNLSIFRISGPAVVAATETVAAAAAPQIPTGTLANAATNVVVFPTVSLDTHSAYNTSTGLYTCPVSGTYEVSATLEITGTSYVNGDYAMVRLFKNSTSFANGLQTFGSGWNLRLFPATTGLVKCLVGDTLSVRNFFGSSATGSFTGSNTASSFSIKRVGN